MISIPNVDPVIGVQELRKPEFGGLNEREGVNKRVLSDESVNGMGFTWSVIFTVNMFRNILLETAPSPSLRHDDWTRRCLATHTWLAVPSHTC